MGQKTKRSQHRQEMLSKVEACLNSGQSKSSWCSEHDISPAVFYYWQQEYYRFKENETDSFVELLPEQDNDSFGQDIQITYPNGVRLSVQHNLPSERLRTLIHLY